MRAIVSWCAVWLTLSGAMASIAPRAPAIPVASINNAIAVERMRGDGPGDRTVLIGSSIVGELPASTIDVRALNLGLSAYGAATGIYLVDRGGELPAVAVIEINELAYAPDSAYADSLLTATRPRLGGIRAARFEFRPSTQAIAGLVRLSRALRRVRSEDGKRRAETRLAGGWSALAVDTLGTRDAVRWVAERLRDWQRRSVRVLLVEIPVHPSLRDSDHARASRSILDAELPSSEFGRIALPTRAWHTRDGRHLEADHAANVARLVLSAVAGR